MDSEEIACSLLRQTKILDKELNAWIKQIVNTRQFMEEFRDWQISYGLKKYHERIAYTCYSLACQIVWFRREGRFDEKPLSEEITTFHLKIVEANKQAVKKANYLRHLRCFRR